MMKLAISAIFCLLTMSSFAQREGFFFHEVQPGETKYGISREYNISISELEEYNPEIADGLKAGRNLLIPEESQERSAATDAVDQGDTIMHEVQPGETLYSLARSYGTTVLKIKDINPELEKDELRVGSQLRILPATIEADAVEPIDRNKFHVHKVQKEETAYSLSRRFSLSLDSLYLLNPSAEEGLQIGQKLKIPKAKVPDALKVAAEDSSAKEPLGPDPDERLSTDEDSSQKKKVPQKDYFLYKIKTGDSFYAFRRKFGVERQELLDLNPELREGPKVGNYIIVPRKKEEKQLSWLDRLFNRVEDSPTEPLKRQTRQLKDSLNEPIELRDVPELDMDTVKVDISKNYRVAVLLPFNAERSIDTLGGKSLKLRGASEMSLQFFQGLKVAADSLADQGMNITLDVMDTRQSLDHVKSLMPRLKAGQYDLIIGPALARNVEYVADELASDEIPVLSPLSNAAQVNKRPNLIQVVPGEQSQSARLADILNQRFPRAKLVFAHSGKSEEQREMQRVKSHLTARMDSGFIDHVVITAEDMTSREALERLSSEDRRTVIIILGSSKVFVSDLVSKVNSLNDTSFFLVGNSNLLDMETVENDYYNRLHLTMAQVRYVDFQDSATQHFIRKYRKKYYAEPTPFAMQGFDVGQFFLRRLWKSGVYFRESLSGTEVKMATGFSFRSRSEEEGYSNEFLFITGVRDFELVRLDKMEQRAPSSEKDSLQTEKERPLPENRR